MSEDIHPLLLLVNNGTRHIPELTQAASAVSYRHTHYSDVDKHDLNDYVGFVLSGRSVGSTLIDKNNLKIIRHAASTHKPLLGICYGMHILAMEYGCKLGRLPAIHTGHHPITFTESASPPFVAGDADTPINVWSHHRYVVSHVGSAVRSIARSDGAPNEMIHVLGSNMYGMQFHPEKTVDGKKLLQNWLYSVVQK